MNKLSELMEVQKQCCEHYDADCLFVNPEQMVVISDGVYEGGLPVEGVRYLSPEHMSGWWLTTDVYDGDIENLKTVHFSHIIEKRFDLAIYMALPAGYRFLLGGKDEHVWFDEDVSNEEML